MHFCWIFGCDDGDNDEDNGDDDDDGSDDYHV